MEKYRINYPDGSWIDYLNIEDVAGSDYEVITIAPQINTVHQELEMYKKRQQDGIEAYLILAAELRLAKLNGEIDPTELSVIETLLEPVRAEIVLGQWIGGLEKLELLNPEQIGQDLYNRIFNDITSYIQTNYVIDGNVVETDYNGDELESSY